MVLLSIQEHNHRLKYLLVQMQVICVKEDGLLLVFSNGDMQ